MGGTATLKLIENVVGSALRDHLTGNSAANALSGDGGNDRLRGEGGDDFLVGGLGADELRGGAGEDTLVADAGQDDLEGGRDADTYVISRASRDTRISEFSVLFDTSDNILTFPDLNADEVTFAGSGSDIDIFADGVRIAYIENIIDGAGALRDQFGELQFGERTFINGADDVRAYLTRELAGERGYVDLYIGGEEGEFVTGDPGANTISGQGGDDEILGMGGDDRLFGDSGADLVDGGLGDDTLFGGDGADRLIATQGTDIVDGELGDDVIVIGRASRDTIIDDLLGRNVLVLEGITQAEASFVRRDLDLDIIVAGQRIATVRDLWFEAETTAPGLYLHEVVFSDGTAAPADLVITAAPEAVDDAIRAQVDTPLTVRAFQLLDNDSDADGDALSLLSVQDATHGTVALDGFGGAIFTPDTGYTGTASFTYTVTDGAGGIRTATVAVTIASADEIAAIPVAPMADNATTAEDTVVTILSGDLLSNDAGAGLNLTSVQDAAGGAVSRDAAGDVVFTPVADFHGEASFTYTVTDAAGASATADVAVTVTPVNDAPVAVDDTRFSANEDANTVVPVSAILTQFADVEDHDLFVLSVTGGDHGTAFRIDTEHVLFSFDQDYFGPDEFTVNITDISGAEATGRISVTVTPVNDAPVAVDDTLSILANANAGVDVLDDDTDVDGDALHVTMVNGQTVSVDQRAILSSGAEVGLDAQGEVLYFTNGAFGDLLVGETAVETVTYTVSDSNGGSDTGQLEVTVHGVTEPQAVSISGRWFLDTNNDASSLDANGDAEIGFADGIVRLYDGARQLVAEMNVDAEGGYSFNDVDSGAYYLRFVDPAGPASFVAKNAVNDTIDSDVSLYAGQGSTGWFTLGVDQTLTYDAGTAHAHAHVAVSPDSATTAEDTVVTILSGDLLANDAGAGLSLTSVQDAAGGAVSRDAAGDVVFTPVADFHGEASFTYTVTDAAGASATADVAVTVTPVNDAPVAVDDTRIADAGTSFVLGVLGNDTDADGDSLTLTALNGQAVSGNGRVHLASGAEVGVSNNNLLYLSNGAFGDLLVGETAVETVTYTVSDGNGGSDTGLLSITVDGIAEPTVPLSVSADSATTAEDTAVTILSGDLLANDAGAGLNLTSVQDAAGGAVSRDAAGDVVFTPVADFHGEASFTYTVTDAAGASATADVAVTVTPVNDAPVAVDDTRDADAGTSFVLDVLSNDTDVDDISLTLTALNGQAVSGNGRVHLASGAEVGVSNNNLLYLSNGAFGDLLVGETAVETVTYTVSDGNGGSDTGLLSITVDGIAEPTVPLSVSPDSATTAEDTAVTILSGDLLANDAGAGLNLTSVQDAAGGAVSRDAAGDVVFTPVADFHGEASFTYTVTDAAGASATADVAVTVTPVNDAPVAVDDTRDADAGTSFVLDVLSNDTDVDDISLTLTALNGQAVSGNGRVHLASGAEVGVSNNNLLYLSNGAFGDLLVGETAVETVTYTVSDGNGGSDTGLLSITVDGIAEPTVPLSVSPDSATTAEDTVVTILSGDLLANDAGAGLSLTSVQDAAGGAVSRDAAGDVVFTPVADFHGEASFTYTVTDAAGASATADVAVTVTPVNDAPVAVDDTRDADAGTSFVLDVLSNDTDVDDISLTLTALNGQAVSGNGRVHLASGAEVGVSNNNLLYLSNGAFGDLLVGETAVETVTYTVSDGNGGSDTGLLSITVDGIAEPTVPLSVSPDSATTAEDTVVTILSGDLLANDAGAGLSLTSVQDAAGGAVSRDAAGDVVFTPVADFHGEASFTYTVTDAAGASATADVAVTVTPVNDAPVAVDDTRFSANEDANTVVPVSAILTQFADVEDHDLFVLSVTGGDHGTAFRIDTEHVLFSFDQDYFGPDEFTVNITDISGAEATGRISVTVTPVNDAPVAVDDTLSILANANAGVDVLDDDTDVDGDALHVTMVNGQTVSVDQRAILSSGAEVGLDAQGEVLYFTNGAFGDLLVGETAVETVTYTVSDSNGGSDTGQLEVTVHGVTEPQAVSISGRWFLDTNNDASSLDANGDAEIGFADGIVRLYDGARQLVAEMNVDAEGGYSFNDVDPGAYYLRFVDPAGPASFVAKNAVNDTIDSDVSLYAGQGSTGWFTLGVDQTLTYDAGTAHVAVSADSAAPDIGEAGSVTVFQNSADEWHSVSFVQAIQDAVVVLGPVEANGGDPAVTRVRNVTDTGFEFQVDEWDYLDGAHTTETIGWLAVSEGTHTLANGQTIVAGETSLSTGFQTINYGTGLTNAVVFGEVTTVNEASAVTPRLKNIGTNGFQALLQEEEAGGAHAAETFSWIAVEAGTAAGFEAVRTGDSLDHNTDQFLFDASSFSEAPVLIADLQTYDGGDTSALRFQALNTDGVQLFVEEEQSANSEIGHTNEVAAYLAIQDGLIL